MNVRFCQVFILIKFKTVVFCSIFLHKGSFSHAEQVMRCTCSIPDTFRYTPVSDFSPVSRLFRCRSDCSTVPRQFPEKNIQNYAKEKLHGVKPFRCIKVSIIAPLLVLIDCTNNTFQKKVVIEKKPLFKPFSLILAMTTMTT